MIKLNIVFILYYLTTFTIISCYVTIKQKSSSSTKLTQKQKAHISPEIINELKDFENLIPTTTVDEIIAKHYLVDGNFRTALKYLRSQEFTQLQKELLNVPEIIDILEFLHLTTTKTTRIANATTMHLGVTKMPATARNMTASLQQYFAGVVVVSDNGNDKMTTNTTDTKPTAARIANAKEMLNNLKVPIRPIQQHQQFYKKEDSNDNNNTSNRKNVGVKYDVNESTNPNSVATNEQHSSLHIVLLKDLEVKAKGRQHERQQQHHHHHHHHHHRQHQRHHKYNCQSNNCYQPHRSLGTFTTFVEEILQHLPNAAYQNMIKDKCQKNLKFAEFYQALRSADFKPLIEQIKLTNNIKNIMQTLNSHDVDVNSLEPIAFKVISWGPNI